ncbi:MAG: hypothetical protein HUU08_15355, partial [Candidatus Brocadia sp.]|nr:hypothetical protein [Candidatus Brocadia sp.]
LIGGSSEIKQGVQANALYDVIPGKIYRFTVAAMGSPTCTSTNRTAVDKIIPVTIVIELIASYQGCEPTEPQLPGHYADPANGSGKWIYDWDNGDTFVIKLKSNNEFVKLAFLYDNAFKLGGMTDNPNGWELCGIYQEPNICTAAPTNPGWGTSVPANTAVVTYNGMTYRITFPTFQEIYYYKESNEDPFETFEVYEHICEQWPEGPGKGGEPERIQTSGLAGEPAQIRAQAVSPFRENLRLRFSENLHTPVQARLINIQNQTHLRLQIPAGVKIVDIPDTGELNPGLYFLQVLHRDGNVRSVSKVMVVR